MRMNGKKIGEEKRRRNEEDSITVTVTERISHRSDTIIEERGNIFIKDYECTNVSIYTRVITLS